MDLAAGRDQTFRPGAIPLAVSVHVDAFVTHARWVPRLLQWCIMAQAALVDQCMSEETTISADSILAKWRSSPTGERIRKLCTNVARGMTIVNKRFYQPMEKGPPAFVSIARGELAPVVVEIIASRCGDKSENNNLAGKSSTGVSSEPAKNEVQQATIKKTLLDYLKVNDSPEASDSERLSDVATSDARSDHPVKANRPQFVKRQGFDFLGRRKLGDIRDSGRKAVGKHVIVYLH